MHCLKMIPEQEITLFHPHLIFMQSSNIYLFNEVSILIISKINENTHVIVNDNAWNRLPKTQDSFWTEVKQMYFSPSHWYQELWLSSNLLWIPTIIYFKLLCWPDSRETLTDRKYWENQRLWKYQSYIQNPVKHLTL